MEVRITCKTNETLPLDKLGEFQGDLKLFTDKSYSKLRNSILKHGFTAPFFIWKKGDDNFLLDGHQRKKTLEIMRDSENYEIPTDYPVVYIDAETEREAKEKLLVITSQYGKMQKEGLVNFMEEFDFKLEDIEDTVQFPEFTLGSLENFGEQVEGGDTEEDAAETEVEGEEEKVKRKITVEVACPNCGHRFNP